MSDPVAGACDYCGLPLAPARQPSPSLAAAPVYCCFGCRFAAQVASERGTAGQLNTMLARLGLGIFLTLNVMVFTMALWTGDVYDLSREGNQNLITPMAEVFRYLALLFSLPVAWLLGGPLAESAWQELRNRRPSTDLLLVAGVAAAFIYSAIAVFRGDGQVYFEIGCVVLLTVTLGRWLEATGKLKATHALDDLTRLLPDHVLVVRDGRDVETPLAEVARGELMHVLAGARIPTDGRIIRGTASIDQQIVTGESQPCILEPGDAVYGGTHNLDGDLVVEVTACSTEGTLQRMVKAVQQARLAKGRYQRLADRVAGWFLPVVAAIAGVAFLWHTLDGGFEQGLLASLSIVLIACPCGLALATPMAVWSALGAATHAQILFASGDALERLATIDQVFFDKTGTLTTGEARLSGWAFDPETSATEIRARAVGLARCSSHPLSRALVESFDASDPIELQAIRTLSGRGLSAEVDGGSIYLGSVRLMDESDLAWPELLVAERDRCLIEGRPIVALGWRGRVRGVFVFTEQLRPEASAAIAACRRLGLHVSVLTGDHPSRAARLADELGISAHSLLLPEDKVAAVERARRLGHAVAMVGDGINDAPALAAADVGIALGCGADVSRSSADVCLLGNDLRRVPWSVELARRAVHTIRQNLFWAFFYNVLGIALAAAGWLNPLWASLAMVLSSLLVIGNSLRLASATQASLIAEGQLPTDSSDRNVVDHDSHADRDGVSRLPQTTGAAP
jgi:heavy metal translocating P-type ATPase